MTKKEIYLAELSYQFNLFLVKQNLSPTRFSILYDMALTDVIAILKGKCVRDISFDRLAEILDLSIDTIKLPLMEEEFGYFMDSLSEIARENNKLWQGILYVSFKVHLWLQPHYITSRNFAWYRYLAQCEIIPAKQQSSHELLLSSTIIKFRGISDMKQGLSEPRRTGTVRINSGLIANFTKRASPMEQKRALKIIERSKKKK